MKNLSNKLLSLLLVLIMIFSMTIIGITSSSAVEIDTTESESVVVATVVETFAINKALTIGLNGIVKVVNGISGAISDATGNDTFAEIATFVGNILTGKGNADDPVLELCKEIYAELQNIELKLDTYASSAAASSAASEYSDRLDMMNSEWRDSVTNILEDNKINTVVSHYFEFDDVGNVTGDETNTQIGYFVAAYCYANSVADKFGNTYTLEEVQALRKQLFDDFCSLHGGVKADMTELEKQETIFDDNNIDSAFLNAINTLAQRLNIENSYSDRCAQAAYYCFLNMEDQFDYVRNGMNKQMMQIAIVEMLYQEYLNMRGEYIKTNYKDITNPTHKAKWDSYKEDLKAFGKLNVTVADYMNSRISKKLVLDNTEGSTTKGISFAIYEYPHDGDLDREVMQLDYNGGEYIKTYMMFDKIAVPTSNGIKIYAVLDGSEVADMKTSILTYKYNRDGQPDDYPLTKDGEALLNGRFRDNINDYACPDNASEVIDLYSTPLFKMNGSTPSKYLQEYLDYVPSDKAIYQLYSYHYEQENADGILTDDHEILTALNMKKSYTDFANNPERNGCELDGKNLVESDYEGKREQAYGSYICYVLAPATTYNCSYLYYESSDDSEFIIKDKDGTVITPEVIPGTTFTGYVSNGKEFTLYMKSKDPSKLLNSLKMQKIDRRKNITHETILFDTEDFNSMEVDENGYYKATFYMPYAECNLILDTVDAYKVNLKDERPSDEANIYINKNVNLFTEGETVQFSLDGNFPKLTLEYNGEKKDIYLNYDHISNKSTGSFVMPKSDVTLVLGSNSEMNTDVYGSYLLSTPEELVLFSEMVNNGGYNLDAALINDIDMSGVTDFTPIGYTSLYNTKNPEDGNWGYAGTFNGNGYVIKNLTVNGSSSNIMSFGVFGSVNGTVKNLGVENFNYVGAGQDSRVGVITGQVLEDGIVTNCYSVTSSINTQIGTLNGVAGGIAGANYDGKIENCHSYNISVIAGRAGGIVGDNNGDESGTKREGTVVNCYTTFNNVCNRGTATESVASVSDVRFASGEIAYLLNNSVTDGTQAWYQNIADDNSDKCPVLKNTHFAVYKENDTYTNGILLGDINCDGVVNSTDAELLTKYIERKIVLTGDSVKAGDVNGDGNTGPADLVKIEAYVSGAENSDTANTGKYGVGSIPADTVLMGDVDLNGEINLKDLELLQKSVVDVSVLDKEQLKAGDIDLTKDINTKDVTKLSIYLECNAIGIEYDGNVGKYTYKGFDGVIVGSHGSTAPTNPNTPDDVTKPAPDNSGATSSTEDTAKPDNNSNSTTGNGTVQTGDTTSALVILTVMLMCVCAMVYMTKRKIR